MTPIPARVVSFGFVAVACLPRDSECFGHQGCSSGPRCLTSELRLSADRLPVTSPYCSLPS